jgi:DNA invertase Pin-like site-specific DNA recombinase
LQDERWNCEKHWPRIIRLPNIGPCVPVGLRMNDNGIGCRECVRPATAEDFATGAILAQAAKPKPALAYIRVSTTTQIKGDGPERQREAIERFARANGYTIGRDDWFIDATTGTTDDLGKRVAFARMLERLLSNGVRTVIVENSDRFARDLIIGEIILDKITKAGGRVYDISGHALSDTDDPTRGLVRQVLGAIAEYNKNVLVLRMRAKRERMRRDGEPCEGAKRFGITPEQKATIARMLELHKDRYTNQQIADMLNTEGHRRKHGTTFDHQEVWRILNRSKSSSRTRPLPISTA